MTRKIVGFDRKIELAWLDFAAAQTVEELMNEEMRKRLWDFLDGRVSAGSSGWNSNRGKVITVLMRIWGPGPWRYDEMRGRAVEALDGTTASSRVAIHWALSLGSYPFFAEVARVAGQHLGLHGEIQLAEVRRRLVESWGDRVVVRNASQRILRSMIGWGVLEDGASRGVYTLAGAGRAVTGPLARLLVEGLLLNHEGNSVPSAAVHSNPALFPFALETDLLTLQDDQAVLRIDREGLDSEYVRLVRSNSRCGNDKSKRDSCGRLT